MFFFSLSGTDRTPVAQLATAGVIGVESEGEGEHKRRSHGFQPRHPSAGNKKCAQ